MRLKPTATTWGKADEGYGGVSEAGTGDGLDAFQAIVSHLKHLCIH
jgi:hypothetical protein